MPQIVIRANIQREDSPGEIKLMQPVGNQANTIKEKIKDAVKDILVDTEWKLNPGNPPPPNYGVEEDA